MKIHDTMIELLKNYHYLIIHIEIEIGIKIHL
jgi:hypothetical protein